ncbi:hypothetical protein Q7P37_011212 [Cladosporium fusiforme]
MSASYQNQDPMVIAKQAERDLNSQAAKQEHRVDDTARGAAGASDSTLESGVDQSVEHKFPGAEVKIGGQGASDNRQIPLSEGGSINPTTGKQTKAADFEGTGGPEDKAAEAAANRGGDNDIRSNIRQGDETVRPAGSIPQNAAGGTGKSTQ